MTRSILDSTLNAVGTSLPERMQRTELGAKADGDGFEALSSHVGSLERRYRAMLASSDNGGFLDAHRLRALLRERDPRLREGLMALAIEDTLGQLEQRWRERLDQPEFDAARPVDYNPVVGLALNLRAVGMPAAALHRVSAALLGEPACLMAKAQVLHQIEALEAAWIELRCRAGDPTRFLCNAIDLIARTQSGIRAACHHADDAGLPGFWPAVSAGVRRECRQVQCGFANRLHGALRAARA